MTIEFSASAMTAGDARHHGDAAAANIDVTTSAIETLNRALDGDAPVERILLKAAAGAGKSHALRRMVDEALAHPKCSRVGVTAFANKQVFPLAEELGNALGRDAVCLRVSKDKMGDVSKALFKAATVVCETKDVPHDAAVILATSHMFDAIGRPLRHQIGDATAADHLFDVLFVDEAWQLPLHRYRTVDKLAPIDVGVGDVGQLPPLDPGQNPWRGDRGYNPYRAWPTAYETDAHTWSKELPAVWRPTEAQLPLWRAFYGDWDGLTCVAGPGDRRIEVGGGAVIASGVWDQVATGVPTLVEVDGLAPADAADIDPPLLGVVEDWLDELFAVGFVLHEKAYDAAGVPDGDRKVRSSDPKGRTLVAVLATRSQAVDDATEMVERLTEKHGLKPGVLVASTVDSWQGQTNAVTVAIHPLSGASSLDEFNAAFGRLAVTCTRATHGLLMVCRAGLDDLLSNTPPRPGTPFGEPGTRQLPRQTHQRILATFTRGTYEPTGALAGVSG
jgi:hypothetical protein